MLICVYWLFLLMFVFNCLNCLFNINSLITNFARSTCKSVSYSVGILFLFVYVKKLTNREIKVFAIVAFSRSRMELVSSVQSVNVSDLFDIFFDLHNEMWKFIIRYYLQTIIIITYCVRIWMCIVQCCSMYKLVMSCLKVMYLFSWHRSCVNFFFTL